MIRSCSEAVAETVGSVMGIAIARGRNTHPVNFEKEIKLRFNLPPLHILADKFIPDLVEETVLVKKTEYFRKGDGCKRAFRNFKFKSVSPADGNFRSSKENQHMPTDFVL